jgi:hypothetical protein
MTVHGREIKSVHDGQEYSDNKNILKYKDGKSII